MDTMILVGINIAITVTLLTIMIKKNDDQYVELCFKLDNLKSTISTQFANVYFMLEKQQSIEVKGGDGIEVNQNKLNIDLSHVVSKEEFNLFLRSSTCYKDDIYVKLATLHDRLNELEVYRRKSVRRKQ